MIDLDASRVRGPTQADNAQERFIYIGIGVLVLVHAAVLTLMLGRTI